MTNIYHPPRTLLIPARRGARHVARRLARTHPGILVEVRDRKGVHHFTAKFCLPSTIETWEFYWGRGNLVHHMVRRVIRLPPRQSLPFQSSVDKA